MQGEVVVLPAGCAHQVVNGNTGHNIKVAQDFIAPQSAEVSLELLKEVTPSPGRHIPPPCNPDPNPTLTPNQIRFGGIVNQQDA